MHVCVSGCAVCTERKIERERECVKRVRCKAVLSVSLSLPIQQIPLHAYTHLLYYAEQLERNCKVFDTQHFPFSFTACVSSDHFSLIKSHSGHRVRSSER